MKMTRMVSRIDSLLRVKSKIFVIISSINQHTSNHTTQITNLISLKFIHTQQTFYIVVKLKVSFGKKTHKSMYYFHFLI